MIRALLLGFCLLLGACASQPPLPAHSPRLALPLQLHVERAQNGQREDWILVIQHEADAIRWSLMDPLGIPQARQQLRDGRWQADGLLPPNPQARALFAALLFALTPTAELLDNYPDARTADGVRTLAPGWQIRYQTPRVFSVILHDPGVTYHVTPLEHIP